MKQLTPEGQNLINDIAQRHHFSPDAVTNMLWAVVDGNGSMAQFNHGEFGGYGQWMRGGMLMIGDMFNNALKSRVSALCEELSELIARQPGLVRTGSFQSQSQGGSHQQQSNAGGYGGQQQGHNGPVSLFVPHHGSGGSDWWPADLQFPSSTGSQNHVRYAYFADKHRLAINVDGRVTVYDTQGYHITGFAQQQSLGGSLSFTSQHGLVDLNSLPVVSGGDGGQAQAPGGPSAERPASPEAGDVFAAIEKLAALKDKGILSEAEFAAKKQELLSRM